MLQSISWRATSLTCAVLQLRQVTTAIASTTVHSVSCASFRTYATATADAPRRVHPTPLPGVRNSKKPADSRKTFLIDRYTYMLRHRPVMLLVQHNSLTTADTFALRSQLKKIGAPLTVVNTALLRVTLRCIEAEDPASWEAHHQYRSTRHPLERLVVGPTAVVSFPTLEPEAIGAAIDIIDRSGGRLILVGASIDNRLLSREELSEVRKLGNLDQMRAQLLGTLEVLRGAGLVQTLSSAATGLYLTLEGRKKQLEGGDGEGTA
ncbi:mitochondrial 54S ribosomal protein uL10m [Limtongia smithiae]|uniref:mitochondrial 54S ribosomal protein uL10m n=1 Tax=Limtongia smithiae TaxID=1125753 RepID=UPI0034CD54DF